MSGHAHDHLGAEAPLTSPPTTRSARFKEAETIVFEHLRQLSHRRDEDGASAVEYGMLLAAISAVIVAIVFAMGGLTQSSFVDTCTQLKTHTGSAASC